MTRETGCRVVGDADRNDVRAAVGTQRGEGRQVALGEELERAGADVLEDRGARGKATEGPLGRRG